MTASLTIVFLAICALAIAFILGLIYLAKRSSPHGSDIGIVSAMPSTDRQEPESIQTVPNNLHKDGATEINQENPIQQELPFVDGRNSGLKLCPKCKQMRRKGSFYKSQKQPDGLTKWCKFCHQQQKEKRKNNKKFKTES